MAARCVVEAAGPLEPAVGLAPVDAVQVVHDVAAADDEHAPLAQRRELSAEPEVVLEWFLRVDRQLDDGDVGVGEGMHQDRPGAVVEAPTVVIEPDPRWLGDLGDLFGEGRRHPVRGTARRRAHRGTHRNRESSSGAPWR